MPLSPTWANQAARLWVHLAGLWPAFGRCFLAGTTCQFITQLGATATFGGLFGVWQVRFACTIRSTEREVLIISSQKCPSLPVFPRKAFFYFFFLVFFVLATQLQKLVILAIQCLTSFSSFLFSLRLFSLDNRSLRPRFSPLPSSLPLRPKVALISHRLRYIPRHRHRHLLSNLLPLHTYSPCWQFVLLLARPDASSALLPAWLSRSPCRLVFQEKTTKRKHCCRSWTSRSLT